MAINSTIKPPVCPKKSEKIPIIGGKRAPPETPIIIRPDISFALVGFHCRAAENTIEKTFAIVNPTRAMNINNESSLKRLWTN